MRRRPFRVLSFEVMGVCKIVSQLNRLVRGARAASTLYNDYGCHVARVRLVRRLQAERDGRGTSQFSFLGYFDIRFHVTTRYVTRDVLIFNGYEEIGGCRVVLVPRAVRMFGDVLDVHLVANVAQGVWFRIRVNGVGDFYQAICQVCRVHTSARNVRERTSYVTRRVRCVAPFNVALRRVTILALVRGGTYFLAFRPVRVRFRTMFRHCIFKTSPLSGAVLQSRVHLRERYNF